MGRAMRWLRRLLTGRKDAHGGGKEIHAAAADWHDAAVKETRRWSFVKQRKSGVDAGKRPSEPLAAALEPSSRVKPCRCGGGEEVAVGAREDMAAAVVIQKAFRGYLARKALRALRSLVKLQALVRGYLVRRQAATTLHRLQALMRLQADSRAFRSASYRKSMEQERIVTQDARMRTPPGHRRRLSDSTDSNYERSPRIVEMDTCHLRSRSSRMVSGRYAADRSSGRLATDLQAPLFSPVSVKQPLRLSTRRCHDRDPVRHAKTAQNTPRFGGGGHDAPYPHDSPAKSVDGVTPRTLWHRDLLASPRYMAGTASSAARLRCQSAPRQQRQPAEAPRASLTQLAAGPRKSTCTRMHHGGHCFHCSDAARTGCSDLSDDAARDYYLDRMW